MTEPTFIEDKIYVRWRGEEVVVWNRLTIEEGHEVYHDRIVDSHTIRTPDGEQPEFITPAMNKKLRVLDIYPAVRVIDPTDDEVTVL